MPVIETGVGNCHVYVDASADLDQALAIVLNAKTHRTSVCNAAESLLVHADLVDTFLPRVVTALQEAGVTVHGDDDRRAPARGRAGDRRRPRAASTSPSTSPRPSYPTSTRRSPTSGASPAGTPRRS